jgi:hypothetical protein
VGITDGSALIEFSRPAHGRFIWQVEAARMAPTSLPSTSDGRADVVYVLALLQVAFILLATVGELLLMGGGPAYLVLPSVKTVLLLVLAANVVGRRRWALITMIVVQSVTLLGFWVQLGLSLLPMVDATVNLVGLLTNVGMPAIAIWQCAALLYARRQPAPPGQLCGAPAGPWQLGWVRPGPATPIGYLPAHDPYPTETLPELDLDEVP